MHLLSDRDLPAETSEVDTGARERDRQADRQTDRQTDRERERGERKRESIGAG